MREMAYSGLPLVEGSGLKIAEGGGSSFLLRSTLLGLALSFLFLPLFHSLFPQCRPFSFLLPVVFPVLLIFPLVAILLTPPLNLSFAFS